MSFFNDFCSQIIVKWFLYIHVVLKNVAFSVLIILLFWYNIIIHPESMRTQHPCGMDFGYLHVGKKYLKISLTWSLCDAPTNLHWTQLSPIKCDLNTATCNAASSHADKVLK